MFWWFEFYLLLHLPELSPVCGPNMAITCWETKLQTVKKKEIFKEIHLKWRWRCIQKITVISNFVSYAFLFCYVGTHVCYICWQYQPFWIVSLFLTDKKVSRVVVCSSIFYYSKKMDPRNYIKFRVKNEIKCAKTFQMLTVAFGESTMSRTQIQLWYNCFTEGRQWRCLSWSPKHLNNQWKHWSSEETDFG